MAWHSCVHYSQTPWPITPRLPCAPFSSPTLGLRFSICITTLLAGACLPLQSPTMSSLRAAGSFLSLFLNSWPHRPCTGRGVAGRIGTLGSLRGSPGLGREGNWVPLESNSTALTEGSHFATNCVGTNTGIVFNFKRTWIIIPILRVKKLRFTQQGNSRDLNARSYYSFVPSFTYFFQRILNKCPQYTRHCAQHRRHRERRPVPDLKGELKTLEYENLVNA